MSTAQKPLPEPLAPWAEIVPGVGPMTVQDLLDWPDDGYRYEVVEGVLVRVAGSGFDATTIGGNVYAALRAFALPRRLGVPTPADGVYKFVGAETGLLSDVGFVEASKVPLIVDRRRPIPFAPGLAAEVASPDQTADDMAAKARRYLHGGTRLVWVLWPGRQEVDVWRPADLRPRYQDMRPSTTLGGDAVLDGEDVVPGFSLAVSDAFADPLASLYAV